MKSIIILSSGVNIIVYRANISTENNYKRRNELVSEPAPGSFRRSRNLPIHLTKGGSCGIITKAGHSLITKDMPPLWVSRAILCAQKGDSGAPLYDSHGDARGILTAIPRLVPPGPLCTDEASFTPMNFIFDRFSQVGHQLSLY